MAKTPITIVTGFLGAGKTTLIQSLVKLKPDVRFALIVNEFGSVGVDGQIISSCGLENCPRDGIIELSNGCICCTVADDFLPAMKQILELKPKVEHIIVETSGLALPQPLIKAISWHEIKNQVTLDCVLTLVDAEAICSGMFSKHAKVIEDRLKLEDMTDHDSPLEELFEDQVRAADLVFLTKAVKLEKSQLEEVRSLVEKYKSPGANVVDKVREENMAQVFLGLNKKAELDVLNRLTHHEISGQGEDHDHDFFSAIQVLCCVFNSVEEIEEFVDKILQKLNVFRIKGYLSVKSKPFPLLLQVVGNRVNYFYDMKANINEVALNKIVMIGDFSMSKYKFEEVYLADKSYLPEINSYQLQDSI